MHRLATPPLEPPLPLLITGVAGVQGYNAMHYFRAKYPGQVFGVRQVENERISGPDILPCNAEDRDGLARLFDRHQFAAVLDCAGNCALKPCELDPELAWRINVAGVENLLSQTVPRGLRLVHLSVDLVFSGADGRGGYTEEDPTDPVTVYGKTMVAGEEAIRRADPSACILRISLPMGVSVSGHAGAIDWICSRFKKSRPATLYTDEVRTPTYADCITRLCERMLVRPLKACERMGTGSEPRCVNSGKTACDAVPVPILSQAPSGVFHAGAPRWLTLFQIAQIINRVGGYDPDCLRGIPRREAGPMPPRAGNVCMDSSKLIRALGYDPCTPWPFDERLVPTDPDWHRRRPPGEPRSPQYLHQVLAANPARRDAAS